MVGNASATILAFGPLKNISYYFNRYYLVFEKRHCDIKQTFKCFCRRILYSRACYEISKSVVRTIDMWQVYRKRFVAKKQKLTQIKLKIKRSVTIKFSI